MSLVSDIISQAYRETNLIPMGVSPTTAQTTEALTLLNTIVLSTFGLEIGDELNDLNIDGQYSENDVVSNWVPNNARLVLNLSSARTFYLDPEPYPGQRLAIVDALGNLATYNLTLNANGRKIEGATTVVLSTNSDARQWIYRADISTWMKLTTLANTDTFPFPGEFDDFFITMLAMRLNPRYGQSVSAETLEALKRGRKNIRARYRNKRETLPEYIGIIGQCRDAQFGFSSFGRGSYWWK